MYDVELTAREAQIHLGPRRVGEVGAVPRPSKDRLPGSHARICVACGQGSRPGVRSSVDPLVGPRSLIDNVPAPGEEGLKQTRHRNARTTS